MVCKEGVAETDEDAEKTRENRLFACTLSGIVVTLHSQSGSSYRCKEQYRGVEQLVARQAHNLEVARSSRTSATMTELISVLLTSSVFFMKTRTNPKIFSILSYIFARKAFLEWVSLSSEFRRLGRQTKRIP